MQTVLLAELSEPLVGTGLASVVGTLLALGSGQLLGLLGLLGDLLLLGVVVLEKLVLLIILRLLSVLLGELGETSVATGTTSVMGSLAAMEGTLLLACLATLLLLLVGSLDAGTELLAGSLA